ncbi:ABC-three component system middle component 2 [Leucobacter celer]|uniref:ABC-three component system middle component 2 n=1 Tax=Leucobacter celer TaxID=668625 RepID=UPI0027B9C72C|nr:ABC-three component system middle component 2 [Leucobacter celer]
MTEAKTTLLPSVDLDRHASFRSAQLLLAFSVARRLSVQMSTTDRVAIYDFFAANPFAVLSGNDAADLQDVTRLELAGYAKGQLSYASLGHRFVSRRERIRADLAILVSHSLVEVGEEAYSITTQGEALAEELQSAYADAYRLAAEVVLLRLNRMTDKALREATAKWAGTHWLLVDLFDDVVDPEVAEI